MHMSSIVDAAFYVGALMIRLVTKVSHISIFFDTATGIFFVDIIFARDRPHFQFMKQRKMGIRKEHWQNTP